jgi:hypothetical protein
MGMNVAHCVDMRAKRLELLLLFVILVTLACVVYLRPFVGESADQGVAVNTSRALQNSSPGMQPVSPIPDSERVTAPEAAVEVSAPVQSVGERADAMLFESEALLGTPFDHAVVAPFD